MKNLNYSHFAFDKENNFCHLYFTSQYHELMPKVALQLANNFPVDLL
jgi:hypothetical protein